MGKLQFAFMAVVGLTLLASKAPPASALDIGAITAKPTADNPQYRNKDAWPMLVGDEYFTKEKWPKARLLIWARADATPARGKPRPDIADPANWTDASTGKTPDAGPDMETDLIFPDSDKEYSVDGKSLDCRHLTVGRNADVQPGGGAALSLFGNLWVRPGGNLYVYRSIVIKGNRHTFFREDWPAGGERKKLHDTGAITPFDRQNPKENVWKRNPISSERMSYFMTHDKPGASTEILGCASCKDEFRVAAGMFIVGRDSRFFNGEAASLHVSNGAVVALMDGAMLGKRGNQFLLDCGSQGAITGGTPDRPLKRDARLGLGYANWMNLPFPEEKRRHGSGYGGLSGSFSGKLIGYPVEGSDARLVIGWHRVSAWIGHRGWTMSDGFYDLYATLQPKITIWVAAKTEIENVRFDDLHRGGIVLPDASAAEQWKNVTYGDGCLSQNPGELLREYEGKVLRGRPAERLEPLEKYTKP
jgi:hypothetical protein